MFQRIRFWQTWVQRSRLQHLASVLKRSLNQSSLLTACCLNLILVGSVLFFVPSAIAIPLPLASIHTYQEQPGQTTFRSKQSLRDRSDRSWQVILFKRYQAQDIQGLYLRLIGFPGMVSVNQKQPITIATGASTQWQANAELDPQTPELPEYAAQYDVAQAISEIKGDIPLQVSIPLGDGSTAQLVVPPFAVHEWRDLNAQSPN
ncbi:MAG: hypothetical protein DCF25_06285 [Leptolyngbya foveolarum]|uniref:DUF3122 domain-containing protein n=1 Tax=Leptolyngbya foveolarum TaxID=47253 RepID=A0A2W4UJR9_9CYAN|nr:MAG: hypothetical protein DCF25_06285 [Leptolyngbya foveolarum]